MVDNGASYSISNYIDDFIEPPTKIGPKIQGFAGSLTTSLIGTVQWYITDDDGRTHSIILPNTSYVPTADIRMLSPQHWAQVTNDLRGALCVTYGDCFLLKWDKKRYRKTIPISPSTTKNVGIMTSAVGNNNHLSYCSIFESDTPAIAFKSTIDFNTQAAVVSESDIKYHLLREEVKKGTISMYHTRTEEQIADIFTKPLSEQPFTKMMGW
jgi:type II secretory pathway pseudopilin PulG